MPTTSRAGSPKRSAWVRERSIHSCAGCIRKGWWRLTSWNRASGPSRKYYRITRAGRAELIRERTAWHAFTRAVNGIVGGRK